MSYLKLFALSLCFMVIALTAISEDKTKDKTEEVKKQGSLTYYYFDG